MSTPEAKFIHENEERPVALADRRSTDRNIVIMLQQIGALSEKLDKHIDSSVERHEQIASKIVGTDVLTKALYDAFPNADLHGHHDYHNAVMDTLKRRKEFWDKILGEVVKYGLIGIMTWVCMTLWQAFNAGPKKI
jgi:hypothetical protein